MSITHEMKHFQETGILNYGSTETGTKSQETTQQGTNETTKKLSEKIFENITEYAENGAETTKLANAISGGKVKKIPKPLILKKYNIIGKIIRLVLTILGKKEKIESAEQSYNKKIDGQKRADQTLCKEFLGTNLENMKDPNHDGPLVVDSKFVSDAKNRFKLKKSINKKVMCQTYVQSGIAEKGEFKEIPSGDGNSWKALRITSNKTGELKTTENAVCTTAERAAGTSGDLNNIYVHYSDTGHITISCGVIDTIDKANEFMEAVGHAIADRPDNAQPPKIRITMHQLNAFGSEKKLIQNQHQMASYINSKLSSKLEEFKSNMQTDIEKELNDATDKFEDVIGLQEIQEKTEKKINNLQKAIDSIGDGPVVAHTNRCFNGFTSVPGETQKSKNNNMSGLAAQATWLSKDLDLDNKKNIPVGMLKYQGITLQGTDISFFNSQLAKISEQRKAIDATSVQIFELEHGVLEDEKYTSLTNELADTQMKFNELSEEDENEVESLQKKLIDTSKEIQQLKKNLIGGMGKDDKAKYKELKKTLASQEKQLKNDMRSLARYAKAFQDPLSKHLDANQKTTLKLYTQILAEQTGVRKELGYPKLSTAQKLGLELLLDQSLGCVTEINCKSGLDRTGFARAMQNALQQEMKNGKSIEALREFITNFESNVKKMDRGELQDLDLEEDIIRFQNNIFRELVTVGLLITARSTGMPGLKWHHDKKSLKSRLNPFEKNMHPMPYLPRSIIVDGKEVAIIKVSKNGKRELTEEYGQPILMGLSQKRGA